MQRHVYLWVVHEPKNLVVQLPSVNKEISHEQGHAPLFTNQMFDDEEITGYTRLEIDIVMTTDTFVPWLLSKYDSKVFPANDYVGVLGKEFPEGLANTDDEVAAIHVCL